MGALQLREYQRAMLEQGRATYTPNGPPLSVLFQLPTGGGKTALGLASNLSHIAKDPANRVGWFAHRDELVQQPLDKLRGWGAPVTALRPGERQDDSARIMVCSIQTVLARGLDSLPRFSMVVFDEARHYASAPQWSEIAAAVSKGRHTIGLDATPSGPLHLLFRHIVQGPSVADLTRDGHLCPAVHIGPEREQDGMASTPLDAYLEHIAPHRAIVFCRDVSHAMATTRAFQAAGVRAECVEGKTGTKKRRAHLDAYLRGEVDVLVNIFCLVEGADLPATAGIIIARNVGEEETWIQIGGRGLRPYPGKSRCLLLDLYGQTARLGLMSELRPWSLDGKGLPSRPVDLPACVKCPGCHALAPPLGKCPGCGRIAPPRPPPKLTKAEMKVLAQDRLARSGSEWDYFQSLVWESRAKGWKPQAVGFIFMQQYGRRPRWRLDHVGAPPPGWTVPPKRVREVA